MLKKNSFEKSIETYPLVMMTTSSCPYCIKAKDLLNEKKIDFKEINSSPLMDKYFNEKFKDYPYVPRIILNGKFIGGYNELEIKLKKDEKKKKPMKETKSVEKKKKQVKEKNSYLCINIDVHILSKVMVPRSLSTVY